MQTVGLGGALHQTGGHGPGKGIGGVTGDLGTVGEAVQLQTGTDSHEVVVHTVAVEDGHGLLAGDDAVGVELGGTDTVDDAVAVSPGHSVGVIAAGNVIEAGPLGVGDGCGAVDAVQDRHQHAAGHGAVGIEGGGTGAVHELVAVDVADGLPEPCVLRHILDTLPFGKKEIKTVGIISGGASSDVHEAIKEGLDAYISGEVAHEVYHYVKESGINMIAGGHYQTEIVGVNLVREKLEKEKKIETVFIDVPTGL